MEDFFAIKFLGRPFRDDDELYLFMISLVATVFCALVHIYLLVLFLAFGTSLFVFINMVSLAVYLLVLICIVQRRYALVGLGISIEVMFYTLVSAYHLGIDNYVLGYYVLVVIMQSIVPYATPRIRHLVTAGVLLSITASIILDYYTVPSIQLEPLQQSIFTISNVFLLPVGTLIELYIVSLLRRLIDRINQRRMDELKTQTRTDPLTGLYNRRYGDAVLGKIATADAPRCVALLDFDDFKQINDTLGHACGDEVLCFLADFLRQRLRKNDLVFRWGGEEFLVILSDVLLPTAVAILTKLCDQLAGSDIPTKGGTLHISATIGVSVLDPKDPYGSIELSDQKMYQGKKNGKRQVVS